MIKYYHCPFTGKECMTADCNFWDRNTGCLLRATCVYFVNLSRLFADYIDEDDSKDKKESGNVLSKLGKLIKGVFEKGTGLNLPEEADGGEISDAHRPLLFKRRKK